MLDRVDDIRTYLQGNCFSAYSYKRRRERSVYVIDGTKRKKTFM